MATSLGSKMASGVVPKYLHNGDITVVATITPAAAATNDIFQMLKVPAGTSIVDMTLDSDDLDSNGAPTILLDVGDTTTANKFIAASNVAQAGGVARASAKGFVGVTYASDTIIQIKVNTGAATFQAGSIRLAVTYTMDP